MSLPQRGLITLRVLLARFIGMCRSRRSDADLSAEIETHLEALAAEHARNGADRTAALAAARRDFGGVEQVMMPPAAVALVNR